MVLAGHILTLRHEMVLYRNANTDVFCAYRKLCDDALTFGIMKTYKTGPNLTERTSTSSSVNGVSDE